MTEAEEQKLVRDIIDGDAFDTLAACVREAKEWARDWTRDDLLSFVEDARKALYDIEDAAYADADALTDTDAETEEEKAGPFVVLLSDHYWARAASFVKARARLHGELPRLAYLTTDKSSFVDGLGSFAYDPKTPWFKLPLGRALSGDREGRPMEVDYREASRD